MAYRFVQPRVDVGNGITDFGGAKLYFFDFGTTTPKTTYSDFALTVPNADPVVADSDGLFPNIYLDIQASVTLRTSNDVIVFGPENIYAPSDSVSTLAASVITVLDAGGNFTATTGEAVLAEIASDWLKLSRPNTISADQTFSGAKLAMADNVIERPEIKDFSLASNSISSVSGVLTIDLSTGNDFYTTLTENITSVVVTNPSPTGKKCSFTLEITQDGAGGAYTYVHPSGTIVAGGVTYTMTTSNNAVDELVYTTRNAGTTWKLDFSQAYS